MATCNAYDDGRYQDKNPAEKQDLFLVVSGPYRNRTCNLGLKRPLLCQLS